MMRRGGPRGGLSTGDPSKIVLYAVWEANLTSELPSTGSRDTILFDELLIDN